MVDSRFNGTGVSKTARTRLSRGNAALLASAALLTCSLQSGSAAGGQSPSAEDGTHLASIRLVAEHAAIVPGQSTTLGLSFAIEPEWHLYWRNAGDSGLPIAFSFDLPGGVTLGEPQWPAPERYAYADGLLDYIYEDRVTLLFSLKCDEQRSIGEALDLNVSADWLICNRDVCLPGNAKASLSLPVRSSMDAGPDATIIAESRARMPVETTDQNAPFSIQWVDTSLIIEADEADSLAFLPYESKYDASPVNLYESGAVDGSRITIRFRPGVREVERVEGIIRIKRGLQTHDYVVRTPPPKLR